MYTGKRRSFWAIARRYSEMAWGCPPGSGTSRGELLVGAGVVGREARRRGPHADRVVVAGELDRVLRHALVELARALGVDLDELGEHLDRAREAGLPLLHEHALQREPRLFVAGRDGDDAAERGLGVDQAVELALDLGEQAPGLDVGRRRGEARRQRRDLPQELARERPEADDVLARLAGEDLVGDPGPGEQLFPDDAGLDVARLRRAERVAVRSSAVASDFL